MEGRICVSRAKETGDDATIGREKERQREREGGGREQPCPKDGKRIVDAAKRSWKSVTREIFLASNIFDGHEYAG